MRYHTYQRKNLKTGLVTTHKFTKAQFISAGLHPALLGGMPQLEAYQVINRWNKTALTSANPVSLYVLPESQR